MRLWSAMQIRNREFSPERKSFPFEMCWLQLQGHVPLDQILLKLREYSSECLQTNHHFTCKPLQFVCVQSNYNQFFSAAHSLQVISPSVSIFLQPEESPSAGHYKQSQLSGTSHQLYFSNQVAVAIFHLQTLIYDYVIMPYSFHYYWTAHVWTLLGLIMHSAQNHMEYTFIW